MATSTILTIVGAAISFGFGIASSIVAQKETQKQVEETVKEIMKNKKN